MLRSLRWVGLCIDAGEIAAMMHVDGRHAVLWAMVRMYDDKKKKKRGLLGVAGVW